MTFDWIDEFANLIRKYGISAARQKKTSDADRPSLRVIVNFLKKGLGEYWKSLDPWTELNSAFNPNIDKAGGNILADLQGRILNALIWKGKEGKVRISLGAKELLASMTKNDDIFCVLWAERLASLYCDHYEVGDVGRRFYVGYIFRAVKKTKANINSVDGKRDRGRLLSLFKKLFVRFEEVVNGFADPEQQRFWSRFVIHYKTCVVEDDKELADFFVVSRAQYYRTPDDISVLTQFMWTVCDCLSKALAMKDRKVVEMLYNEGEKILSRASTTNEATVDSASGSLYQSLTQARGRLTCIINQTDIFLSGRSEAEAWLKKGDAGKAIETYQEVLGKREDNTSARIGLVALLVKQGKIKEAESLFREDIFTLDCLKKISTAVLSAKKNFRQACERARFVFDFLSKANLWNAELGPKDTVVANCLFECGRVLGKTEKGALGKPLVNEYPQLIDFFKRLAATNYVMGNNGRTASDCAGVLLVAASRMDEAREYVRNTIMRNPTSASAWTNLGSTYGESSIDGAKCFCRAIQCPVKWSGAVMNAHISLGRYFEHTNQIPRALREYEIVSGICRDNGWTDKRQKLNLSIEFLLRGEKLPDAIDSNEDMYAKLGAAAGELISSGVFSVLGVVIGHPKGQLRIWHEPLPGQCEGAELYANDNGRKDAIQGMPISLLINRFLERESVASWEDRKDGAPWDIYPKVMGVVTKVDYNRGFRTILLDGYGSLSVSDVKLPSLSSSVAGTFIQCCVVKTSGSVEVCWASPVDQPRSFSGFVREVRGKLARKKQSQFGFVDDVFVPERLCKEVPSGTQMTVLAVKTRDPRKREDAWLAVAPA